MADDPKADTKSTDIPAAAAASGAAAQPGADKPDKDAKSGSKSSPSMRVRISSPFKVFFDDEAMSLSGENATGMFDILPHHHNFISLLNECELVVKTKIGLTRVRISGGIMHVKADQVVVFLNV